MSKCLNKCAFIGFLGKDPEVRFTPAGMQVTSISVGVNESWKDKQGVKQERTEWINCTAFDKLAKVISDYLKKGAKVYIEGKMKTDKYQAKDGTDRYATKIIISDLLMLDSRPRPEAPQQSFDQGVPQDIPGFDDDFPVNF
jgi:single-strand DNA-binding protein